MAQRRMLSLRVVDTDEFLDMPPTTQLLYFHLLLRADDDGFVSNPKKIIKICGSAEDDIKILIGKKFVIPFQSGVCVIRHWKIHNFIRSDRYTETDHLEEKRLLALEDGKYKISSNIPDVIPDVIPTVATGKDRLGKNRLEEVKEDMSASADAFTQFWKEYPKKELKKKAEKIWKSKKLDSFLQEILIFIEKAKLTDRWKKGYVKQPPAFLNGECWNDDISAYNDKFQNKSSNILPVKTGKYENIK